jgi:RNA polymerase sigma-70 factor, ECF subfamily
MMAMTRAPATKTRSRADVVPLSRETSDADLVQGLARREDWAVAELYDRFGALVRRVLLRSLGGSSDVEDVMQDVFLVVVRRAREIREASAFRSFVVGVTLRCAKNELRKRAVRRVIGFGEPPDTRVCPPHDAALAECVQHLYRALDRLDSHSRVLFVLRHVEGLELTEIAAAEGCSLATVKRRLARVDARFEAIAAGDPVLSERLGPKEEP